MRIGLLSVVMVLIPLLSITQAQNTKPAESADLELRLLPDDLSNGFPASFVFELVNVSDHDIRLPEPTTACSDSYTGSLSLRVCFLPAAGSQRDRGGFGCFADAAWENPTERIAKWKTLHPAEVLRIKSTLLRMLHRQDVQIGSYEFWAEYAPPHVRPEEEIALRQAGSGFPRTHLTSQHLKFEMTP